MTATTMPAAPLIRVKNKGYYKDPSSGDKYVSVTTILDRNVAKNHLVYWAGNTVARCALDNLPYLVRASRALIRELGKEHTILLSTHILPEVEMTCDRVIIIHRGRVAASSSLAELASRAGAETVIVVEAEGSLATEPLRQLAGVGRLESETIPNGTRLRITTAEARELTPRLCDLAVKQGWKLRELRPQRQSLEEMFVRIVEAEEPVGA